MGMGYERVDCSLEEAKNSPEWPQRQIAIQEEMDLLKEKGTYIKV